jgi:hypothetical protein
MSEYESPMNISLNAVLRINTDNPDMPLRPTQVHPPSTLNDEPTGHETHHTPPSTPVFHTDP